MRAVKLEMSISARGSSALKQLLQRGEAPHFGIAPPRHVPASRRPSRGEKNNHSKVLIKRSHTNGSRSYPRIKS